MSGKQNARCDRVLYAILFLVSQVAVSISVPAGAAENGAGATDEGITPGGNWESYNNTLDGQRYSPLSQINVANAPLVDEICRAHIADDGSFQPGLIMIDDTIYATAGSVTVALDSVSCATKWRSVYPPSQQPKVSTNRGVAYLNGRLFRGTNDARLIALDSQTGQQIWKSVVGDARLGEFISSAPVAWNGIVVVGLASSEFGNRGRIVAFDAVTGREIWRFYTIPIGHESGASSWQNKQWAAHGGGGTWSTFTVDEESAEIFVPVGNAVPDFSPADRPGLDLFTNCVVVLDILTGRLKWWYQTEANDAFDHDLGAAPVLYRDANDHSRVAAAGKDGYLHIINRVTHRAVAKSPLTTIDPVPKVLNAAGVKVCPGALGGVEWNGPAFDPNSQTLFAGAVDWCMILQSHPRSKWIPGGINYGGSWSVGTDQPRGWITAVDATLGAIRWQYHADAPVVSGITPTAGGIVIGGDNNGNLLIFNSATGALLKKFASGGSLSGGVITYERNERQYIAFTSGNISISAFGAIGHPSVVIMALPINSEVTSNGQEPRSDDADSVRGQQLFNSKCAACHGFDGTSLTINGQNLRSVGRRMTLQQLVAWVKDPKPPMPKVYPDPLRPVDELEIRDIASFVYAWSR